MEEQKSVFETLSAINVNEHTETKNGLTYLSWSWAWGLVKKLYPKSTYKVHKSQSIVNGCVNELNYFTDGRTCWVEVEVTIEGDTEEMYLPVMNYKNQSIGVDQITSFNINTSIQRCLAKNIAINFGLGFYIYAGEDIPDEEKEKNDKQGTEQKETPKAKAKEDKIGEVGAEILRTYLKDGDEAEILKRHNIRKLESLDYETAQKYLNYRREQKEKLDLNAPKEDFY